MKNRERRPYGQADTCRYGCRGQANPDRKPDNLEEVAQSSSRSNRNGVFKVGHTGAVAQLGHEGLLTFAGFPTSLFGEKEACGGHHVCATIWGGIFAIRDGRPSRRDRLSCIDGLCLVFLKRDASHRVAA